ncbi:uncharacterized protein [Rutidosis leptorrhynchoides]|uniref:uncharacterized protein n=1 Tax=Rutidosis leptorrhynchoides TaxID=125765 RepID=UPI003A99C42A
MSFNIRGFGSGKESKIGDCRKLINREKPDILAIQETKSKNLCNNWVSLLWGSNDFGFIQKDMIGKSGGMLLIWENKEFIAEQTLVDDFFLAVKGIWKNKDCSCYIVNVYGPHDDSNKVKMWDTLESLVGVDGKACVLCGDFNEVRVQEERFNCVFNERRARMFNNFIEKTQLIDIPMGGKKFTRICDNGIKFAKLDRFLVSEKFFQLWEELSVLALERKLSDHCPIILRDRVIDFGPKPINVFDDWLDVEGADQVISSAWNERVEGWRLDIVFRLKLKKVKMALKEWCKDKFGRLDADIADLQNAANNWEKIAESRILSDDKRGEWMDIRKKWLGKEKVKSNMARQKAKGKWILEGDENSKYFYSIIRR